MPINTSQMTRVILSVSWGLFFGLFVSSHTLIKKIELKFYDSLIKRNEIKEIEKKSPSLVLIEFNDKDLTPHHEKVIYANLVENLLQSGASVVVLNLRHNWRKPNFTNYYSSLEGVTYPLQSLVKQYHQKIVLVTPVEVKIDGRERELKIYNHLLKSKYKQLVSPKEVQGFFEYNLAHRMPKEVNSPARQFRLADWFVRTDNLEKIHLESVPLITIKKHHRFSAYSTNYTNKTNQQFGINFAHPNKDFIKFKIEEVCDQLIEKLCKNPINLNLSNLIDDKIAIVGFQQGSSLNTMPIHSPYEKSLSALELQAYSIASLMTESLYVPLPRWLGITLLISSGMLISYLVIVGMKPSASFVFSCTCIGGIIVMGISFAIFTIILFSFQITIPILLPIFTGIGCISSALVCVWVQKQQDSIAQQQLKIQQCITQQQRVSLIEAQKILYRIGDQLHSSTLQELKLLMDDLELMQWEVSSLKIPLMLEKVEKIGIGLRLALYDTRYMANQLNISNELREGLVVAIARQLQLLQNRDDFYLKIIQDLQILPEPIHNPTWLDAREEIFQFFKEAIANVIYHARPPHGHGSYLKVSLCWKQACELTIENDGVQGSFSQIEPGYGTRLMARVASELPHGYWERKILAHGTIRVRLVWQHNFQSPA